MSAVNRIEVGTPLAADTTLTTVTVDCHISQSIAEKIGIKNQIALGAVYCNTFALVLLFVFLVLNKVTGVFIAKTVKTDFTVFNGIAVSVVLKVDTHGTVISNVAFTADKITGILIYKNTVLDIVGYCYILKPDTRRTVRNRNTAIKPLEGNIANHNIICSDSKTDALCIAVTIDSVSPAIKDHVRRSKAEFGFKYIFSQSHVLSNINSLVNVSGVRKTTG